MMKKNETNKLVIAIVAIAVLIAILGTSTFAYWQWASAASQQTNVYVKVDDAINMTITPTTTQTNAMYPISDTNCKNADIAGSALVTIVNNTGIQARPTFKLKVKIIDKSGNNITNTKVSSPNDTTKTYAQFIKYAVAETSVSDCGTSGNLATGSFTATQTTADTTWNDSASLGTSVTFTAARNTTTSHTYKFWAWIDSSYVATNTGSTVSDKLQDAKITVSWSEGSIVSQITS